MLTGGAVFVLSKPKVYTQTSAPISIRYGGWYRADKACAMYVRLVRTMVSYTYDMHDLCLQCVPFVCDGSKLTDCCIQ